MIKCLSIENFKLYKEQTKVPFSQLNLLTGINGKGKSTVLQIFLLLSQSALGNRTTDKIILNGVNVKLGNIDDVKNKDVKFDAPIHFGFEYDNFTIDYSLFSAIADASELSIERIDTKGVIGIEKFEILLRRNGNIYDVFRQIGGKENFEFSTVLFDLFIDKNSFIINPDNTECRYIKNNLNLNYIHYVSADRSGPKNYYDNKSLGHFVSVGALGENTVNVLYQKGDQLVNDIILKGYCKLFDENEDEISKTIEDHTNFWFNKIFQGAKVQVTPIKGEDLLKIRINPDGDKYFKPTNVGYGFSYSLPIIVAGLTAKPGEILIVENPEAHLHPFAQSILAKFLSLVSACGIQVIVESHSEHILNGFRIAVYDKLIDYQNLNVLYFDQQSNELFEKINIDNEGGITNWPTSFFDQSSNDLNHLLSI